MIYLISILLTISWLWHIVIAFKNQSIFWGIVMILFSPLVFIYGLINWAKCKVPYIILLIGIGLMFTLSAKDLAGFSGASSITIPQAIAVERKSSGIKKYGSLNTMIQDSRPLSTLASKKYYTVVEVYLETCAICKRLESGFKPFLNKRKDVLIKKVRAGKVSISGSSQQEMEKKIAIASSICGTPHIEVYAPGGVSLAADQCGTKTGLNFLRQWISHETGISVYKL